MACQVQMDQNSIYSYNSYKMYNYVPLLFTFNYILHFTVKNKIAYRRSALITIQKTIRGYLTKKKHGPRIKGTYKIKQLNEKLKQLESIAGQLKKDKDISIKQLNNLKREMREALDRIKVICLEN